MLAPPPLPRTLQASLRDLSSQKAESRASAIVDLVRYARGDESLRAQAIACLERALLDEAPTVRAAAAVALGDLAASEALAPLLVAIEDGDGYVRQMAINALGEIRDPRATARLSRALADDRPEVRYQAVIAFSRVASDDGEAVTGALERALGDADDSVRYIALRTAEERADAGTSHPRLVEHAQRLIADPTRHVALAAAILVAKAGQPDGNDLILKVVSGAGPRLKGPAREDENEAVLVAGVLGMKEAIPFLERRAWGVGRFISDTCEWSAKTALARMGHARAVAEITRDLGSSKRETIEAAVVAAGRARMTGAEGAIRALGPDQADPELVLSALTELGSPHRPSADSGAGCSSTRPSRGAGH
jgi:HEAT repeat protein